MLNRELYSVRLASYLYGRGEELDWLEREVNDRDRSRPDVPIVVLGEPGIGKTNLSLIFSLSCVPYPSAVG